MLVTLEGMTVFWHPVISSLVAVAMIALQPFLESYTGLPASTVMLVRPEQSLNAPYELYTIAVTVDGMARLVRLVHPLNAPSPMNVTPSEMVTLVRPEQPTKAYPPMLVTLLGISMDVRTEQPSKARSPMLVTLLGISMDVKLVQ